MMKMNVTWDEPIPCQVIGIRGHHKYLFVWAFDGEGNVVIYEYITTWPVASAKTLQEAQNNAEEYLRQIPMDLDMLLSTCNPINDRIDYGFTRTQ